LSRLLAAGLVFLGSTLLCAALSATSPSGQQDSSTPQSVAPAPAKPEGQAPDESKKKTKKVWTNEELDTVKGSVSVVGDNSSNSGSPSPSGRPRASAYDPMVDSYARKLAPLRSEVADIDRKIQKAKETKGNASEDTDAYLRVYADKRGDIQAKIDAIVEDARQRGVTLGDLDPGRGKASAVSYDRLVDTYLKQLAPLRLSLADIDRKIQKAKEAKGNSSEDTAAYLRVYADKRGDIQAKIDTILENARQHGVAPGDLR
jgi:hypothetical protein